MAEEQRCQAPKLCANKCGFLGNPATLNLCSKCFRDSQLSNDLLLHDRTPISSPPSAPEPAVVADESPAPTPAATPTRCKACRRRVGLTGFECRCGSTFCGVHRHPESHPCGFDYKAAGKYQIARDNPLVKAQKLRKI